MSVLLLGLLLSYQSSMLNAAVVPVEGATVVGEVELDLSFDSTLGSMEIDPAQLSSIVFGKQRVSVTGQDGTVIHGSFPWNVVRVQSEGETREFTLDQLKSLSVIVPAQPVAGEITSGRHANGMTYHLRAPSGFEPGTAYPALVVLHGSNMNAMSYLSTIVERWPGIAEDYLLIGVNGENRSRNSTPESPRYNYSYVNFVGEGSKFKGYPGTDRESPALLKELVEQLKAELKLRRVFVGGHSQGAFLTYSTFMYFPELFDGAFPVAGGLIVQAEPGAFNDEAIRQAQRSKPIAIVHGSTDSTVKYSVSESALASFREEQFPMVRLFSHDTAGHRFMFLPIDQAIRWLEEMSGDDPEKLMDAAEDRLADGRFREACALVQRAKRLSEQGQPSAERAERMLAELGTLAATQAVGLLERIRQNETGAWVDDFLEFQVSFGLLDESSEVLESYDQLRSEHQPKADALYKQSKADYQAGRIDEAYAKYQEVVDSYYASSWYRKMKGWLERRKQ